jgi:ABC-type branched-subunit amino acid transport system ATPase component
MNASSSTRIGLPVEVEGLGVTYRNGSIGCIDVSFSIEPGTVVAALGRNGAGKTSLLRGIAGFQVSEGARISGGVTLGGRRLQQRPGPVHRAGVVFVPERDKVFPSLTVEEHFKLVNATGPKLLEPFDFPAVRDRWKSKAGLLSGGERQMLALAVAWAQRPKLLLVDELSLGLAPVIVTQLLRNIREMVELNGMTVLLVEQDAAAALRVADQVMVLDHGAVIWRGASSETDAVRIGRQFLGLES